MRIKSLCKELQLCPPLFFFPSIPNKREGIVSPREVAHFVFAMRIYQIFCSLFVLFGSYLEECMSILRKKAMWLVNKIYMQIPSCRREFEKIIQVDSNCSETKRQNKQIRTWLFLYSECSLRSLECLRLSLFVFLANR